MLELSIHCCFVLVAFNTKGSKSEKKKKDQMHFYNHSAQKWYDLFVFTKAIECLSHLFHKLLHSKTSKYLNEISTNQLTVSYHIHLNAGHLSTKLAIFQLSLNMNLLFLQNVFRNTESSNDHEDVLQTIKLKNMYEPYI